MSAVSIEKWMGWLQARAYNDVSELGIARARGIVIREGSESIFVCPIAPPPTDDDLRAVWLCQEHDTLLRVVRKLTEQEPDDGDTIVLAYSRLRKPITQFVWAELCLEAGTYIGDEYRSHARYTVPISWGDNGMPQMSRRSQNHKTTRAPGALN